MRVAFIGLGRMGTPMATNVAGAGHDLVLHNRTASKAQALAADVGASVAATPREAADGAEAVVTMLPDIDVLRETYHGPDGVLAGLGSGAVAIDMGTTGPAGVAWLDGEVRAIGATVVDAPVSGSTASAAEAALTIMAGGPREAFERVEPLLRAMGGSIYHLGPTGSGAAMKLAVNAMIYGLGQAVSESLVLAERFGIDRELTYDVFEHSAIAAPMVKYRREQFVNPDDAPVLFAMTLAHKDLRLIVDLASQLGAPMAQSGTNLDSYGAAIEQGFGDRDMAGLAQFLRERAASGDHGAGT